MKFDSAEIFSIETGTFKLDGGAMFGSVPKTLWEKAIPPDELNRIPMALRLILVKDSTKKRNLLVDTGVGEKSSEKMAGIYSIDHSKNSLEKSLKAHGLTYDDITDVVLTHLHFDHAGGATQVRADGSFVPTFKNAKYYLQKDNFDWANKPNSRESASYLQENFIPLKEAGQLVLCDGAEDFSKKIQWPEVSVRTSYGHTIGLQCPLICLGDKKFFYPSDLIPTSSHVPVPWTMGYDIHIIKLMEEKELLLAEAVRDRWIFVYEHDPVIAATEVVRGKKHYERSSPLPL
jgi:glyoxylase-like metal-dependent hydrolase (beta-lactamase superfamily II)